jgi:hypothetical protein
VNNGFAVILFISKGGFAQEQFDAGIIKTDKGIIIF